MALPRKDLIGTGYKIRQTISATIHQGHSKFGANAGMQCTCNALAFLLRASSVSRFNTQFLDTILDNGIAIYNTLGLNTCLLISDLPNVVKLCGNVFHVKCVRTYAGDIHSTATDFTTPYLTLKDALRKSINTHSHLLITLGSNPGFTSAIYKDGRHYYLFDPHSRTASGLPDPGGVAVLLKFDTQAALVLFLQHYAQSISTSSLCPFEITQLEFQKESRSRSVRSKAPSQVT